VVVDGQRRIGNGRVLPAGPLRAPLGIQMERAQAVLVLGSAKGTDAVMAAGRERPLFHGRLEPDANVLAALKGHPVLAFAGIGDPGKFFATLVESGIDVRARRAFPDHHLYRRAEAQDLLDAASAAGLVPVTTEKDHVRLAGEADVAALAGAARALPVTLKVAEEAAFRDLVLGCCRA
jgi:tetraacyldisaccharide 4'-kinase